MSSDQAEVDIKLNKENHERKETNIPKESETMETHSEDSRHVSNNSLEEHQHHQQQQERAERKENSNEMDSTKSEATDEVTNDCETKDQDPMETQSFVDYSYVGKYMHGYSNAPNDTRFKNSSSRSIITDIDSIAEDVTIINYLDFHGECTYSGESPSVCSWMDDDGSISQSRDEEESPSSLNDDTMPHAINDNMSTSSSTNDQEGTEEVEEVKPSTWRGLFFGVANMRRTNGNSSIKSGDRSDEEESSNDEDDMIDKASADDLLEDWPP